MTKTEFTTIADALKTKQSWVRKSFEELLSAWEQATQDMECIGKVHVGNFDMGEDYIHSVYMIPHENKLYYREGSDELDYYIEDGTGGRDYRDKLTMSLIRWAAPKISSAITRHFKNIQKDIDLLSDIGQELRRITSCLDQ